MNHIEVIEVFNAILDGMGQHQEGKITGRMRHDDEKKSIGSVGLDSLSVVEFMIYVDDAFQIPKEVAEKHAQSKQVVTVGEAVKYVLRHTPLKTCPSREQVSNMMPPLEL